MTTFALYTDIITVPLLSFFLRLQLGKWQNQGFLKHYRIILRRIGKHYYELNIQLAVGSSRTERLLLNLLNEMQETLTQELRNIAEQRE